MGGHNFLNYIMFWTIFNAPYVPIGGFKFCLDTKNNGALPLDPTYTEHLNVWSPTSLPYVVATQFAIKNQLEDFNPYVLSLNPMLQTI